MANAGKIQTSEEKAERKRNLNPLFPVKTVEAVRDLVGSCNQSLLMKIAAKEFIKAHDVDEIAKIVGEQAEGIKMARMEAELAAYKARQKGK